MSNSNNFRNTKNFNNRSSSASLGNNNSRNVSKSFSNKLSNTLSSAKSFLSKNNSRVNTLNNRNVNNSKKMSSSSVFSIIAILLLIIIIAVGAYFVYRYTRQKKNSELVTKQFIPYIHDASINKRVSGGSLPTSSDGNEYNINFWMYVNDYGVRRNEDKCIIYRGDTPNGTLNDASVDASSGNVNLNCNPGVWLLKNVNTMRIVVGLDTNYNQDDCNKTQQACQSGDTDADVCDIENFPLQKWVAVNITMRNNVIDVFFNGTLMKSCILKGYPIMTNGDMLICPDGGFNGHVSNLKFSSKALSVKKIKSLYKSGPTL